MTPTVPVNRGSKPAAGRIRVLLLAGAAALGLMGSTALAETRVAVLAFELRDLTLAPGGEEERARTASVAPMLRRELADRYGYAPIVVDPEVHRQADAGFGYLFDRPEAAAALGARYAADWIAVGRVHKPSFLFAYLKLRLVNVHTGQLQGDFVVEVKGPQAASTARGVAVLAAQMNRSLAAASTETEPRDSAVR